MKRAARWAGAVAAVVVLALAGVALGIRAAGSHVHETELGDVRLEVDPAWSGEVDVYIPIADWGLRAGAFSGPVRLKAEARSVDRRAVLRAAGGNPESLERARNQLDDVAASALIRAALFGTAGAAVVGLFAAFALVALRRAGWRLAAALGAAVLVVGAAAVVASVLSVRSTFDPEAFERPRFYAHGAELLQLLDAAAHSEERAERYRSKLEATLVRLSDLLASSGVGGERAVTGAGRRILLASDLHANNNVVGSLEELASPTAPVVFAGDFGHQGTEGEARIVAPRLGRLGSRAVAVSGNHDSTRLMQRLAGAGLTVLTTDGQLGRGGRVAGSRIVDILGLRVAGWSDPLEWGGRRPDDPERIFSFSELEDEEERRAKAEDDLVRWFDSLLSKPDVVVVHQNGLAQHLAATLAKRPGHPPLVILTGHDHKQHVDRHGRVVVVDAGSAGAGGLLGVGDERVAVGELHFDPDEPVLRAVDLIEVDPFSGAAQAERVIVGEGEPECEDPDPETGCRLGGED